MRKCTFQKFHGSHGLDGIWLGKFCSRVSRTAATKGLGEGAVGSRPVELARAELVEPEIRINWRGRSIWTCVNMSCQEKLVVGEVSTISWYLRTSKKILRKQQMKVFRHIFSFFQNWCFFQFGLDIFYPLDVVSIHWYKSHFMQPQWRWLLSPFKLKLGNHWFRQTL